MTQAGLPTHEFLQADIGVWVQRPELEPYKWHADPGKVSASRSKFGNCKMAKTLI